MADITVTTTSGATRVVTDTLGAAASAQAAATSATNAATSATASATSATASATSATNASNSASAAATSETNAAGSASAASTSASAAATSASNAATSASAASTSATNASNSAGAAATSETNAAASASAASTSASAAATSASNAATSEAGAAAATVTELESGLNNASFASMTLAAIDKSVFSATIVDAFVYDTSKDSDGGKWRERCSHTSWFNETLSGNWLGSAANETAARAISGATTGSYYYDTTAAGFYTLNAGSGKTATYRGNVRQFPAKVLITVEAARVVLWDLTQAGVPMWMVFKNGGSQVGVIAWAGPTTTQCVVAANGVMVVGSNNGGIAVSFIGERYTSMFSSAYSITSSHLLSARNAAVSIAADASNGVAIAGTNIFDASMTVLPNAPVDVATGLPVPTIAVATNGGVSVIKDDGNVWDVSYSPAVNHSSIAFTYDNRIVVTQSDSAAVQFGNIPTADVANISSWRTGYYLSTNQPATLGQTSVSGKLSGAKTRGRLGHGNAAGLSVLVENPATPTKGMVAYITKDYNTGWMVGDIKGAWLADTVAETVTGTELVTNGTFTTDTTGWTAGAGATIASVSGELEVTATATSVSTASQTLTTVIGKTYTLSGTFRAPAANTGVNMARARVYDVPSLNTLLGAAYISGEDATTSFAITFTATATNTTLNLDVASSVAWGSVGDKAYFDNISCRLADVDRSVKAKGLQVFGSITKAAVASGAALVGYSGFSAANYLEQPYNSDLDFGTGDFCYMGWFTWPGAVAVCILQRGPTVNSDETVAYVDSGGLVTFRIKSNAITMQAASAIPSNVPVHIAFVRISGVAAIYLNGAVSYSVANTQSATQVGYPLVLGKWVTNPQSYGQTMSLWRASATAPSAEQIKHIYATERPLFEASAQCCLAGTSNAVTALAYDEETDLLHVGTSYGRSTFHGLELVESEATAVGAITALSAVGGVIAQGGATAVDVYVPAMNLREELNRAAEQKKAFGQALVAHDFTATASQTTFTLPVGWEIVAVYQQGSLKRETTSWTRSFDGFKWSAVLGTGATVSDWISILAKRV